MDDNTRKLTRSFEHTNNQSVKKGVSATPHEQPAPPSTPLVNIVPPSAGAKEEDDDIYTMVGDSDRIQGVRNDQAGDHSGSQDEGQSPKRNDFSLKNILRSRNINESPKLRPNLTLKTTVSQSIHEGGSSRLSEGFLSPIPAGRTRNRVRRLSTDGVSVLDDASIDKPLISARVLSYVEADDMDEFQDIQEEFKHGLSDAGSWLPQLNLQSGAESISDEADIRTDNDENEGYASVYRKTESQNSTFIEDPVNDTSVGGSNTHKDVFTTATSLTDDRDESEDFVASELAKFRGIRTKGPLKLFGNSLGFISPRDPIRLKIAQILLSKIHNILYYILLNSLIAVLVVRTYSPAENDTKFLFKFTNWADYFIFILSILFSINDGMKIIAFGFWDDSQMFAAYDRDYVTLVNRLGIVRFCNFLKKKYNFTLLDYILPFKLTNDNADQTKLLLERPEGRAGSVHSSSDFEIPRAFMRSSWNRIDFTSTLCFWIGLLLSINDYYMDKGIRIFEALAVLRILRMIDTDTVHSSVFRGLKVAMPQLINVGTMLVYFWILFGVLGVQSFRESLKRRCVWYNPDDPTDAYVNENQFCGGYLDPVTLKAQPYVFQDGSIGPMSKGFLCPQYSKCVSGQNPYNGRISFDNIIYAMEMVFVVMSVNTFTNIMYYTMDTDTMAAAIFFVVAIFFLTIWLMNLLIAVLVSSFELANEEFKKNQKNVQKIEGRLARIRHNYWKYITKKASESVTPRWASNFYRYYLKIEPIFLILIVTDLVLRCQINADISESNLKTLFRADFSICSVLLYESLLRLFLFHSNIWGFLTKPSYVWDLFVAIATFAISCKNLFGSMGRSYYWLSVLQISRFYRVNFYYKFSSDLWKRVLSNWVLVWDLTKFYFFLIFLVSIIMAILFEGVIPLDQMSEFGFGMFNFANTFVSLFIVASTENWTNILYALQEYSPNISSSFFASVLLITWFVLSNSVIVNIFIAVIAATMDVEEEEKRPLQIKHYLNYVYPRKIREYTEASLYERIKKKLFMSDFKDDSKDFKHFLIRGSAIMKIAQNSPELTKELQANTKSEERHTGIIQSIFGERFSFRRKLKLYANNPFYKKPEIVFIETEENGQRTISLQLDDHESEKLTYLSSYPSFNYAYFILPPHHAFRRFCQRLVPPSVGKRTDGIRFYEDDTNMYGKKIYFNHVERDIFLLFLTCTTIMLIVVSCYYTPLYRMEHNVKKWGWSTYWDCGFVMIFSVEFVIKTVADGVLYTPNAYLRNPWNAIDFFVLVSQWVSFLSYLENDADISRVFKGLTALRALRLLTISNMARETFKLVVFDGLKKILAAAFVSMTLLFPFSVWGLSLFRGRLGTCNDGDMDLDHCYNEFTQTVFQWDVMMPRVYGQPYLYLDNFSSALRSLYEIVSLEGWTDLLQNLMNSTGVGTVASTFATPGNGVFLIIFNFLSMLFILNVFVSFIISNHAKTTGSAYLTIEEKSWFEAKKLLSQAKPRRAPDSKDMSKAKKFFYMLASERKHFYYVAFYQLVLYVHIIVLLCRRGDRPSSRITFEDVYFMFSTTIFLLQELFRVYGEGFFFYIRSKWNSLRISVILTSFTLTAIGFRVRNEALLFNNINELFHLVFFLFVIPQNNTLSELVQTAAASWPSIFSLTYTWAILFLVYAIALNQIFGLTRLGPNTSNNINFRTVIKSLIVLFRCSFGEGWNYIMADLTVTEPFCFTSTANGYSDCGSQIYAYMLLISWNILSMYIFLNMFISVVIANFSYVYRRGGSKSPIDRKQILRYIDAWAKYDPNGRGKIKFQDLPKLMHSFDGPLSFKIWEGSFTIKELVKHYMEVNPEDPYDVKVDLVGLNQHLELIDRARIIKRRLKYRRFIQQVRYTNNYGDIVMFSNLIELTPLYTTYVPRECLGIDEYVRNLYYIGKVDKFLKNERNFDVLNMVVTAWKYGHRHVKPKVGNDKSHTSIQILPTEEPEGRSSRDFNNLSTPLMDYGVNDFMWSPRALTNDSSENSSQEYNPNNDVRTHHSED